MSKRNMIVSLDLTNHHRSWLLKKFAPVHANVYGYTVTVAYNRGWDEKTQYPDFHTIDIVGEVITERTQAIACFVNNSLYRKDGKPYFITMSVRDGVPPVEAGSFNVGDIAILPENEFRRLEIATSFKPRSEYRPDIIRPRRQLVLTKKAA